MVAAWICQAAALRGLAPVGLSGQGLIHFGRPISSKYCWMVILNLSLDVYPRHAAGRLSSIPCWICPAHFRTAAHAILWPPIDPALSGLGGLFLAAHQPGTFPDGGLFLALRPLHWLATVSGILSDGSSASSYSWITHHGLCSMGLLPALTTGSLAMNLVLWNSCPGLASPFGWNFLPDGGLFKRNPGHPVPDYENGRCQNASGNVPISINLW